MNLKNKSFSLLLCGIFLSIAACQAAPLPETGSLRIFWLPTHASTLIVTPSGEVVLVDSGLYDGNPENLPPKDAPGSSADRIYNVLADVIKTNVIDHYISTHWHVDHIGGIGSDEFNKTNSSRYIAVRRMYGRSDPTNILEYASTDKKLCLSNFARYKETESLALTNTIVVSQGYPILDEKWHGHKIKLTVVAANGQTINSRIPKQPTSFCSSSTGDNTNCENRNSIALLLTADNFRYLETGDLWCEIAERLFQRNGPLVGGVDVYRTAHHGGKDSNPDSLFRAARPKVAVLNNVLNDSGSGSKGLRKRLQELMGDETTLYQMYLNEGEPDSSPTSAFCAVRNFDVKDSQHCFIMLEYRFADKSYSVTVQRGSSSVMTFSIRDKRR